MLLWVTMWVLVALCSESLLDPLTVVCGHLHLVHMCPLVLSVALSVLLSRCGYLLSLYCAPYFPSLSFCYAPPQPLSLSLFVSMYSHCPTSAPPSSSSLEENIQTPQRQHLKFILQQLWLRGKGKEEWGGGPREWQAWGGFRAGLEPCTWQAGRDGFRMG